MLLLELPKVLTLPWRLRPVSTLESPKFVIAAQTRSGTHLLADLLSCHPRIACDLELFDEALPRLLSPESFLDAKRQTALPKAYGFILHLRHILMLPALEQDELLAHLTADGWSIVHLRRRNALRQQLSLEIGKIRGCWHGTVDRPPAPPRCRLEPDTFVQRIRLRQAKTEMEEILFAAHPRLSLVYEQDLLDPARHQQTLDKVFEYLGLPTVSVSTNLARTTEARLTDVIENYPEVERAVIDAGLERFLDDPRDTGLEEPVGQPRG